MRSSRKIYSFHNYHYQRVLVVEGIRGIDLSIVNTNSLSTDMNTQERESRIRSKATQGLLDNTAICD